MARRIPIAPDPNRPHIDMPDTTLPPGSRMIPQNEPSVPVTAAGLSKAGATGVRGGVESIVGSTGDIPDMAGRAAGWAAEKLPEGWVDPEAAQKATETAVQGFTAPGTKLIRALQMLGVIDADTAEKIIAVQAPGSPEVGAVTDTAVQALPDAISGPIQDVTRHQAVNPSEQFMETAGNFAGTAFLPGGALTRAAAPFVTAAAVETAGAAVPEEYEEAARLAAGILTTGGMGVGTRSFRERSALRKVATTPGAVQRVRQLLRDQGMTDQEATARMKELGSESTLMDVGPEGGGTTRQEGQRIQAGGGPGRGVIDPMLRAREIGSNRRLMEDVGATVGPYRERATELDALKQRLEEKGGEQRTAARTQEVQPADPQSIVDDLDVGIQKAKNEKVRAALQRARDSMFLRDEKGKLTDQLDTSSEGLLDARQALSEELYTDEGLKKKGAIVKAVDEYYGKINQAINPSNPALRKADAEIAAISKEEEAFKAGETTFEKGREAPGPVGFAETWNTMSAEERAAAVRGMGAETHRLMGQFGKNRVELQKMLVGEGKWPAEKLETMIGPEKTKQLETALEREKIFQETYQKVVQGSKTAETMTKDGGGGVLAEVGKAVPEVAAATAYNPAAGLAVAGSNLRRIATDVMSRRSATARDAEVAKLITSKNPADIDTALRIMRERGSVWPQAMVPALMQRKEELGQ